MSLRKPINLHCKSCIYDAKAMGTWKQQVTLCSVWRCPLFDVRPTTDQLPESVLKYYGVNSVKQLHKEWDAFAIKRQQKLAANSWIASKCTNDKLDSPEPKETSDVGC
jgi:hypothetical protein